MRRLAGFLFLFLILLAVYPGLRVAAKENTDAGRNTGLPRPEDRWVTELGQQWVYQTKPGETWAGKPPALAVANKYLYEFPVLISDTKGGVQTWLGWYYAAGFAHERTVSG